MFPSMKRSKMNVVMCAAFLNSARVSQFVLKFLADYNVEYNEVFCFPSDNAAYVITSYETVFIQILPNLFHLSRLI